MLTSRGIWRKVLRWNKRLAVFAVFCLPLVLHAAPYILQRGPVTGFGLPFWREDLARFYSGRYTTHTSDFLVDVYYVSGSRDLRSAREPESAECLAAAGYDVFRISNQPGFPDTVLVSNPFSPPPWVGNSPVNEASAAAAQAEGVLVPDALLFYHLIAGEWEELCAFIPLFEQDLRYHMNVRRRESLLPLPAVIQTE